MNTVNRTPGPWKKWHDVAYDQLGIEDNNGRAVCWLDKPARLDGSCLTLEENVRREANAALIAAAPEMADALLAAHEFMKNECTRCYFFSSRPDINGCTLECGGCDAILKVENALRKAIGWRSAYETGNE